MKLMRPVALLLALLLSAAFAKPVQYTTTIDYLDYVFFDHSGPKEYYSLELYEQRIRELAEMGITQINLRVNCMGMALHPSKLLPRYGEEGRWHYNDRPNSMRLIETLKHYDPVGETIRLGHKYGMQVWCWENIIDESFWWNADAQEDAEAQALCRKHNGWPMLDPFFAAHPECWAMRKPEPAEALQRKLEEARKYPVGRIVFTAYTTDRPTINFGKDDIELLVSEDNATYTRYAGPWTFSCGQDAEGHNYIEIGGLAVSARYIKVVPVKPFGADHTWTLAIIGYDFGRLYNTHGDLIPADWGFHIPLVNAWQPMPPGALPETVPYHERSSLNFNSAPSMAFDAEDRQIGCAVGYSMRDPYFRGVVEFCNPAAKKRLQERFQEYADYPFDGYIMSMNCHSNSSEPDIYSYNPAVRDRIMKRLGKDIWKDDVPLEELIKERQAGLCDYLEGCKQQIGARPMLVEGWGAAGAPVPYGRDNYGSVYPDYARLIRNGTIEGVLMYYDFAAYFTPEVTGGRAVRLGLYYDLGKRAFFLPASKELLFSGDFAAAMDWYTAQGKFDLIDLYETVCLSHNAKMQETLKAKTGK